MKSVVLQVVAHYLADAKEEVPIILHLEGRARFKNSDILDPLSAQVVLKECHPKATVDYWMKQLRERMKMQLVDDGIFVPKDWTSKDFATAIVQGTRQGIRHFKTMVDDERILSRCRKKIEHLLFFLYITSGSSPRRI